MQFSWYRKLFHRPARLGPNAAFAKADPGDAESQFALGVRYGNTTVPAPDFVQAAAWYRKAADQDHSPAQFNLGLMYARGQGVTQSDSEAVVWIRRAAEGGDAGAQFDLGTRHHRISVGKGEVDAGENRIEAYKWMFLSAAQGYRGSEVACERITLGMTREEVVAGNQRASSFAARPNPTPD